MQCMMSDTINKQAVRGQLFSIQELDRRFQKTERFLNNIRKADRRLGLEKRGDLGSEGWARVS